MKVKLPVTWYLRRKAAIIQFIWMQATRYGLRTQKKKRLSQLLTMMVRFIMLIIQTVSMVRFSGYQD